MAVSVVAAIWFVLFLTRTGTNTETSGLAVARPTTASSQAVAAQNSPTPRAYGARDNPVPSGLYYTLTDHSAKLQVRVVDVVKNATQLVKQANMLNQDPPPGNEYVLVKLEARYFQGQDDRAYTTSSGGNRFLAQNRLWGAPVISIAPEPKFEGNDIFPGAVVVGWLPGKYLPTDAIGAAVLEYQGVYFALDKPTSAVADQKREPLPAPDPAVVAAAPAGGRFRPIPLGNAATITDKNNKIAVSVSKVVLDAGQEVKAANLFNPDPPDGYQYVLVRATLNLLELGGSDPYHTTDDIRFYAANRLWGGGNLAIPPEPKFGGQDIFTGASVDGWMGARYLPKELVAEAALYYKGTYFALH